MPSGRTNHGAVLDNNGNIIIFGGYTSELKYSNDIHMIDLINTRWVKPIITGKIPLKRERFSIIFYRNFIWIFGGYSEG